jgi:AcrR family transcriptional regulator
MKLASSRRRPLQRVPRGEQTRQEILQTAVDLASAEGLEGVTIGRLARELDLSKSGLFAHFGSKEELQLATVDAARARFVAEIVEPCAHTVRGLERLRAMLENWLSYVERSVFRGGCFFFAASAEMDDRPGPVRDLVAELTRAWLDALEEEIRLAQAARELRADVNVELLAFQLHAFVQEANWLYRLHAEKQSFARARAALAQSLTRAVSATGKAKLGDGKPAASPARVTARPTKGEMR